MEVAKLNARAAKHMREHVAGGFGHMDLLCPAGPTPAGREGLDRLAFLEGPDVRCLCKGKKWY